MTFQEAKELSLHKWNLIINWIKNNHIPNYDELIEIFINVIMADPKLKSLDHACGFCEFSLQKLKKYCKDNNESFVGRYIDKCTFCPLKTNRCGNNDSIYNKFVCFPNLENAQEMYNLIESCNEEK